MSQVRLIWLMSVTPLLMKDRDRVGKGTVLEVLHFVWFLLCCIRVLVFVQDLKRT